MVVDSKQNRIESVIRPGVRQFKSRLRSISPKLVSNIPGKEDEFLLKFLRAGGYKVEGGVTVLLNYTEMIRTAPKYFGGAFNDSLVPFKRIYDYQLNAVLPSRCAHYPCLQLKHFLKTIFTMVIFESQERLPITITCFSD